MARGGGQTRPQPPHAHHRGNGTLVPAGASPRDGRLRICGHRSSSPKAVLGRPNPLSAPGLRRRPHVTGTAAARLGPPATAGPPRQAGGGLSSYPPSAAAVGTRPARAHGLLPATSSGWGLALTFTPGGTGCSPRPPQAGGCRSPRAPPSPTMGDGRAPWGIELDVAPGCCRQHRQGRRGAAGWLRHGRSPKLPSWGKLRQGPRLCQATGAGAREVVFSPRRRGIAGPIAHSCAGDGA